MAYRHIEGASGVAINVYRPPTKVTKVTHMVRVGEHTVVVLGADGKMYHAGVLPGSYYISADATGHNYVPDAWDAAGKLGVISPEDGAKEAERRRAMLLKRQRAQAAETVADYAKELGIVLTKAQLRRIEQAVADAKGGV